MSGSEPLRPEADELATADGRIGSVQKRLAWLAGLLVVVGVGLFALSKPGGDNSPLLLSDGDEDVAGDSLLLLSRREDGGDGD